MSQPEQTTPIILHACLPEPRALHYREIWRTMPQPEISLPLRQLEASKRWKLARHVLRLLLIALYIYLTIFFLREVLP